MYFLPGVAGRQDGVGQLFSLAHAGELDQHGQVDACDHLDLGLVHDADGKVAGRAAEHVGQQHDAAAVIHLGDAVEDVETALLHVVVRPDADRGDLLLLAHYVLECRDELGRETPVGYQNHSDHRISFYQPI